MHTSIAHRSRLALTTSAWLRSRGAAPMCLDGPCYASPSRESC